MIDNDKKWEKERRQDIGLMWMWIHVDSQINILKCVFFCEMHMLYVLQYVCARDSKDVHVGGFVCQAPTVTSNYRSSPNGLSLVKPVQ